MKHLTTRQLCITGLLTAVIMVLTLFVRLPTTFIMMNGYAHVGDAGILLAALILGPSAALPAAVGSALADLFAGFVPYMPFTLVVKGAMGWAAGKFLKPGIGVRNILVIAAVSAFMVLAYFLTDMVLFGWAVAVGSIVGNLSQAIATIALGFAVLALPMKRI